MHAHRPLRAALLALACGAPLSAQQTHVVSVVPGPDVDFTSLSLAVAAAAPGDTLLVRSGLYEPVTLGKGLAIVADAGASVTLDGDLSGVPAVRVLNLPAGQSALLRGLTLRAPDQPPTSTPFALDLSNVAGVVTVESCTLLGGAPTVRCVASGQLMFVHCSIVGRAAFFDGLGVVPAGVAFEISSGFASAYECALTGGEGMDGAPGVPNLAPTAGREGLRLAGGTLLAGNGSITGGQGGDGLLVTLPVPGCLPPADGAAGVVLSDPSALLRQHSAVLGGGPPGAAPGGCPAGSTGPAFELAAGAIVSWPLDVPRTSSPAPVREGQTLAFTINGTPGAVLWLVWGTQAGSSFLDGQGGSLGLTFPANILVLGPLPGGGALPLSATIPPLPAALESATLFVQPAQCLPIVGCTLGTPISIVLLDAAL